MWHCGLQAWGKSFIAVVINNGSHYSAPVYLKSAAQDSKLKLKKQIIPLILLLIEDVRKKMP